MITEDYVPFEIAKLLKEKGFDESCEQIYDGEGNLHINDCGYINEESPNEYFHSLAPTHQRAMKWLREVHNIFIEVCLCWSENPRECPPQYYAMIVDTKTGNSLVKKSDCKDGLNPIADKCAFPKYFAKYDETVEKALKYALEKLI